MSRVYCQRWALSCSIKVLKKIRKIHGTSLRIYTPHGFILVLVAHSGQRPSRCYYVTHDREVSFCLLKNTVSAILSKKVHYTTLICNGRDREISQNDLIFRVDLRLTYSLKISLSFYTEVESWFYLDTDAVCGGLQERDGVRHVHADLQTEIFTAFVHCYSIMTRLK